MLSHFSRANRSYLLHLFNLFLLSGYVPSSWNTSIIIPLLKPAKHPDRPDSYRPISLTSNLCKVFGRLVNSRLSWHLEAKNFLPSFQAGFRKGLSTVDHIVALECIIKKGFDDSTNTYAIFLDLSKAFDSTWLSGLLFKLASVGIDG